MCSCDVIYTICTDKVITKHMPFLVKIDTQNREQFTDSKFKHSDGAVLFKTLLLIHGNYFKILITRTALCRCVRLCRLC